MGGRKYVVFLGKGSVWFSELEGEDVVFRGSMRFYELEGEYNVRSIARACCMCVVVDAWAIANCWVRVKRDSDKHSKLRTQRIALIPYSTYVKQRAFATQERKRKKKTQINHNLVLKRVARRRRSHMVDAVTTNPKSQEMGWSSLQNSKMWAMNLSKRSNFLLLKR
jgi:hypothetical protein